MKLSTIFIMFRWWILLAIGLVVIENVAWILEPSVFGPVIDALIDTAGEKPLTAAASPLILWISVFAVNSGVGAFRRAYDQNIYLSIYTKIATNVAYVWTFVTSSEYLPELMESWTSLHEITTRLRHEEYGGTVSTEPATPEEAP